MKKIDNSKNPMISVIIPAYQSEKTLARAVISVINQTYENLEIIIVNNGSTDKTQEIASSFLEIDKRIKIVKLEENKLPAGGRNTGVNNSSGDYIAFLDADDEWMPEFLREILSVIIGNPKAGLIGAFYEISNGIETKTPYNIKYFQKNEIVKLDNYFQILAEYRYSPFCSSSVVIRKSILLEINGFPINITLGEDLGTWFKLYSVTEFGFINSALVIVHQDAENRSYSKFEKPFENYYPVEVLLEIVKEKRLLISEQKNAINYFSKHQINTAKMQLLKGQKKKARSTLITVKYSNKNKKLLIKYFILSLFPYKICKRFIDL